MNTPRPFSPTGSNRGVALVVTIALIAPPVVLVMAFFSRATANRSVEAVRLRNIEAEQVALSAADNIKSKLLADLVAQSDSETVGDVTLYRPKTATDLDIKKKVSADAASSGNLTLLVRQSVNSADADATEHSTSAASANGRTLTTEQWNLPGLNTGTGFGDITQLPNWVYLSKNGTATNSPQTSQTLGRFAYNIYDISGLLDANVAGHKAGVSGADLQTAKLAAAGADLTALGLSQAQVNSLVTFRNPVVSTASATYADYVVAAASEGFLSAAGSGVTGADQNRFFQNRRDLVRYAAADLLPNLTAFSPALNAPTAKLDGDGNGTPDDWPQRYASAVTITRYRDDGTSFTEELPAGTPCPSRRFSLAKLAWLTPSGPATGITPAAIQSCFGLLWNPSDAIWIYTGPTGSGSASEIATLEDVKLENREPNLFELLNAGIGRKSLDLAVDTIREYDKHIAGHKAYSGVDGFEDDRTPQYQVISIAANIIDQADTDNYPTRIKFNGSEFFGLEDLPLISSLYAKVYYKYSGDNLHFGDPPVSFYLIPQLWNPHRASAYSSSDSPSEIKLTFVDGNVEWEL